MRKIERSPFLLCTSHSIFHCSQVYLLTSIIYIQVYPTLTNYLCQQLLLISKIRIDMTFLNVCSVILILRLSLLQSSQVFLTSLFSSSASLTAPSSIIYSKLHLDLNCYKALRKILTHSRLVYPYSSKIMITGTISGLSLQI